MNQLKIAGLSLIILVALSAIILVYRPAGKTEESTDNAIDSHLDRLKSLNYISEVEVSERDRGKEGIISYIPGLSFKNLNLYCSGIDNYPAFLDMYGNIVHTIPIDVLEYCTAIKPYDEDNFLVIESYGGLALVGWDSRVKWVVKDSFHHDVDVAEDGDIYVLKNDLVNITEITEEGEVIVDYIIVISPDGMVKREIPLADMVLKNRELTELAKTEGLKNYDENLNQFDILHTNTLDILDSDVIVKDEVVFRKGDILFCMRNLNTIGVLDTDRGEIIWWWGGGELEHPHQPSQVEDGRILVFDNGVGRKYSRVLEVNPTTNEVTWEYKADPLENFFTIEGGSAQRLPNGNTLITETGKGHVFEVTRAGDIVWEFWNPFTQEKGDLRKTIYRMTRFTSTFRDFEYAQTYYGINDSRICDYIKEDVWGQRCRLNSGWQEIPCL